MSVSRYAVRAASTACGYDQNLGISDAMRTNIRAEVQKNLQVSEEAQGTATTLCDFYQTHPGRDAAHDLSQYVSLALYLEAPPHFLPRVKQEELPPDAAAITGFAAVLERFYDKAGLHAIWVRHQSNYAALMPHPDRVQ